MIDIIKSVVTFAIFLTAGVAAMAHAHLDDGDDSPSQLRLIDLHRGGPAMQSTIATAGFPAISASGAEIAVLRSLDAAAASAVLDVLSASGGRVLKRFDLLSDRETESPTSENVRQRLAGDMVAPNAYLAEGKFKSLEILFVHTARGTPTRTPDWETENRGLRILHQNPGPISVLEISSLADASRVVRLEWPLIIMEPMGDGGEVQCVNKGIPMKAWTDVTGELIVLNIWHSGGPPHGCDLPEEWRVLRLPQ